MSLLAPAALYYLLVFVVAFGLGALRELVLVPSLGRGTAELAEAPLLLAAIIGAAWLVCGWLRVPPRLGPRLGVGLLALAFVIATEFALAPLVRGSVAAWIAGFTPLTWAINLVLWTAQAVAPALVRRG